MPEAGARPMIELDHVSRRFEADRAAVDDVALAIAPGEFFSLLGPSGCGKTTTLRMIAGFEEPDSGRVLIEGEDVTFVSPRRRAVHMVFQDYALFPHMSVAENVAFGLKIKKTSRDETVARVRETLESMQLAELAGRRPAQLSGGQRQRVALSRALVNRPAALLLDEPLGALDLKLRKEMQLELKQIQQRTETTFVYVTHDQEEALTMSDRIAVMLDGRVEQVDSPRRLYERPATPFVAEFIGVSNTMTLSVDRREDGLVVMDLGEGSRLVAPDPGDGASEHQLTIRPERIALEDPATAGDHDCRVRGRLLEVVYLGSMSQAIVETETGERLIVHYLNDESEGSPVPGSEVSLGWAAQSSFVIGSGVGTAGNTEPEKEGSTR